MKGKFYGLGVGSGDPELITLKAYKILQNVDILCVPKASAEKESLALRSVAKLMSKKYETLDLLFPMTKEREILEKSWAEAGEKVARKVHQGNQLAFITIGDPMLYSTYGYVLKHLQKHHPQIRTETVPGIMAMSACAAMQGIPLAEGDETLAVIPAAYGLHQLEDLLQKVDNVVLLKVHKKIEEVSKVLNQLGLQGKAMVFSRCGYPDQFQTADLEQLQGKNMDYMSLMLIKKNGFDNGSSSGEGGISG